MLDNEYFKLALSALVWILGITAAVFLFGDAVLYVVYNVKARSRGLRMPKFRSMWPLGLGFAIDNVKHHHADTVLERWVEMLEEVGRNSYWIPCASSAFVMTREPENIKAILATNFKDFSLGVRYDAVAPFLGDGIFTLSGEGWKHSRAMLRPQFSREQVAHVDSLAVRVDYLLRNVNRANNAGEYIDIQRQFHLLTMDTATEFLFGESVDSLNDSQRLINGVPAVQFVDDYETALKWSILRLVVGPVYWVYNPKEYREAVKRSRAFVMYFAKRALEHVAEQEKQGTAGEVGYVFSRELAKVTKDPNVIRDQAFNILLAGRDTTASLLAYCTYYLGNDERVWNKLRAEILENFGYDFKNVTFESLKRSKYLTHVINEVLRLNPVVPRNFRTAIRDTTLPRGGGADESQPIYVPKGSQVIYSVYEMQRNPEFWGADADQFRPERWTDGKSHGWDYLPFNGGPRICLGQQFALTEVSFTLLRLCQSYSHIHLRDKGQPLRNSVRLTSSVLGGVWVKLERDPLASAPVSESVAA